MPEPLSAALRRAIIESGRSAYEIGAACGVSRNVITRFLSGERGLTLIVADRLATDLGLELRPVASPRKWIA